MGVVSFVGDGEYFLYFWYILEVQREATSSCDW